MKNKLNAVQVISAASLRQQRSKYPRTHALLLLTGTTLKSVQQSSAWNVTTIAGLPKCRIRRSEKPLRNCCNHKASELLEGKQYSYVYENRQNTHAYKFRKSIFIYKKKKRRQ